MSLLPICLWFVTTVYVHATYSDGLIRWTTVVIGGAVALAVAGKLHNEKEARDRDFRNHVETLRQEQQMASLAEEARRAAQRAADEKREEELLELEHAKWHYGETEGDDLLQKQYLDRVEEEVKKAKRIAVQLSKDEEYWQTQIAQEAPSGRNLVTKSDATSDWSRKRNTPIWAALLSESDPDLEGAIAAWNVARTKLTGKAGDLYRSVVVEDASYDGATVTLVLAASSQRHMGLCGEVIDEVHSVLNKMPLGVPVSVSLVVGDMGILGGELTGLSTVLLDDTYTLEAPEELSGGGNTKYPAAETRGINAGEGGSEVLKNTQERLVALGRAENGDPDALAVLDSLGLFSLLPTSHHVVEAAAWYSEGCDCLLNELSAQVTRYSDQIREAIIGMEGDASDYYMGSGPSYQTALSGRARCRCFTDEDGQYDEEAEEAAEDRVRAVLCAPCTNCEGDPCAC